MADFQIWKLFLQTFSDMQIIILSWNIMDQMKKMFLSMVFKVFIKNKWKSKKLKFSRLLHDIKKNSFLKRKKWHVLFTNLLSCSEILPKTRFVWQTWLNCYWVVWLNWNKNTSSCSRVVFRTAVLKNSEICAENIGGRDLRFFRKVYLININQIRKHIDNIDNTVFDNILPKLVYNWYFTLPE